MKRIKTTLSKLIILGLIILILLVFIVSARIYYLNDLDLSFEYHRLDNNDPDQLGIKDAGSDKQGSAPNDQIILPDEFYLEAPFISQAPLAIWDELHESACEEASLLIYKYWQDNRFDITPNEAEKDINLLINYEDSLGIEPSISLNDLSIIATNFYNINYLSHKKVDNFQQIMETLLTSNSPIIIGAAGKLLDNPNFRNGGPNYHMLVIIGWDTEDFITNDPGTKNGKSYRYKKDVLFSAIHDWNKENILLGEKNILFSTKDS